MTRGITRRQLLLSGAAALAAGALPWWKRLSFAEEGVQKKNLILVFVGGGWDVTACLDPKPSLATVDSPPGDVRLFGDLPILTGPDRPSVARFFESWGDVAAVVNGIEVRSIAHEECTKRILTGTNAETSPDLGAINGVENGADRAVPYMILGNTAYTGPFGGSTGRAGLSGQFITLLHPDTSYSRVFGRDTRFVPRQEEKALIDAWVTARAGRDKARRATSEASARRLDDFIRSVERRDRLKPLLNSLDDFTSQLEFLPQIDLAIKVLQDGISRSALIEHPGEWDTHDNNDARQLALHEDLYAGLHALMDRLDAADLIEETVVVVLSEMSRTPKRNAAQGKDHWPVTSAMVLGADVRGRRAFGGTDELMQAVATDLATGRPDEAGQNVTAAAFAAGVLTALGVEPEAYFPGVDPLVGFLS